MMVAMRKETLKFSFLTASKNEERDIRMAIESMVNQTYSNKEIIIVDDSTDRTKDIIREYADKGVKLFEGARRGCCEARNIGIHKVTGDVIVFVNADAKLPPDFLEKIYPYYQQGADWVVVRSQAFNIENIYARFMQAQADLDEGGLEYSPYTSEGYSVRTEAARKVGGISGDYPVKFCRDYTLGQKLTKAGFKKVFDRTIIAPHKAPDHFAEYWDVRKLRGVMSAYYPYFVQHRSLSLMALKFLVKDVIFFSRFLLVVPAVWRVGRIASYSAHPYRDFFPFYYAYFLQEFSLVAGEWEGWRNAMRVPRVKSA